MGDMEIEDLIDDVPVVITLSKGGYIKAVVSETFKTQGRGGRGVQGARLKEDDLLVKVLTTSVHSYLLFFSNKGKVYRLKAYQVPVMERTARGTALVNLLQLDSDEFIEAVIDAREFDDEHYLMFVTRNGTVKKTALSEYDKSRTNGLIAINLSENDELVRVVETTGEDDIFIISKNGQTIRFSESAVRPMGRTAGGVRGMKLRDADVVVAAVAAKNIDSRQLLIVTEGGFGKRTDLIHYPRKGRGTMGVRGIKLTEARGAAVVAARLVDVADQIILVSSGGVLIRTSVEQVAQQGRDASGVRVMSLGAEESVAALAPVTVEGDEDVELVEDDILASSGEGN
jgi:DNA gyrase subunit A